MFIMFMFTFIIKFQYSKHLKKYSYYLFNWGDATAIKKLCKENNVYKYIHNSI